MAPARMNMLSPRTERGSSRSRHECRGVGAASLTIGERVSATTLRAMGTPPRDAATIMLVRDSRDGLQVFMLRRNLRSDFVGGAYVFPGGAVDEADRHADLEAVCEGRSDDQASVLLGVDRGGLAFWVAAIRECFEEAGVLLAYGPDGEVMRLSDAAVEARFARHRAAVDSGERRLLDVCAEERLRLAV